MQFNYDSLFWKALALFLILYGTVSLGYDLAPWFWRAV